MVNVLYSPGWGTGWSSDNVREARDLLLFDQVLIDAILNGDDDAFNQRIAELGRLRFDGDCLNLLGANMLCVRQVPRGTRFIVTNYDGNESFRFQDKTDWVVAQ